MNRNIYGFPIMDSDEKDRYAPVIEPVTPTKKAQDRLGAAKQYAAEARTRNFPLDCDCRMCVSARNLPGVLRILAKWNPMDQGI